MRVIRKYQLSVEQKQVIDFPMNAHVLDVMVVNGKPVLWALVDPKADAIPCLMRLFQTGDEFHEWSAENPEGFRGEYRGSFVLSGREFHLVQAF